MRAANLERHLGKVHTADAPPQSPWHGVDRAVMRMLWAPPISVLLMIAVIVLRVQPSRSTAGVLMFGFAAASVPLVLAALGKFRAQLEIAGDELHLHYALGMVTRTVSLASARVEVGGLRRRQGSGHVASYNAHAGHELGTHDVSAGIYLRIDDGTSAVTIRARKGTEFRKHWDPAGWTAGDRRRRWDVELDRAQLVCVEYALAARGMIAPRAPAQ